ncbi:hypothetical protein DPMN_182693 [Dreissena polymorpha]|uniref:Uncharacterized protein n=1 Tax=Dreissena polymorpha TaxID=45954 RepID=A0A9D4I4U1_DREPO|nr:hypothetical protein DPMN_182693 [Dreissena polymorpha]
MPCPFESDMVLILCRSTGIRDAQEEKDTSSINGTTTCRSRACFPGLYQLLSRSLHPPRSGLIPCTGCFPVAAVQVPTPYAVKVPHSTAVQVSAAAAAVPISPTSAVQQGCSINDPFKHMLCGGERGYNMFKNPLKNAPPTGGHVFQATGTTFELVHIIGTNLLTKFHDDRTIHMASRVLTRKKPRPLGGHVFPPTGTIFKLIQDIIGTNHLTKFHSDRTTNAASRVLTRKNAPPPDIIRTNLLTKFHEDRKINVAYRLLTRKTAPPPGGHVFSLIWTKLVRYINETSVLTKNTAPPPGGHVFQRTRTIFELNQHIILTKNLTKTIFELNQHIILTKNLTNFELRRGINEKNVLTKFHEDQTKNVAFRVFTRQNVDDGQRRKDNPQRTTHDGQRTITKAHHEHVLLR